MDISSKKLMIFDCDGTLVSTKSGNEFRKSADDWQWLPGRLEKLADLDRQGIKMAIATNQGGVAFGYLDPNEMRAELGKMAQEAHIPFVAMCFSHPKATIDQFKEDSPRRKPGPGMLLEILASSGESKGDTLMVGDMPEDWGAARNAGVDYMWEYGFFSEQANLGISNKSIQDNLGYDPEE